MVVRVEWRRWFSSGGGLRLGVSVAERSYEFSTNLAAELNPRWEL